jgi:hypothetical protein
LGTRYRAALVAEDGERRQAGRDLETRSEREFADLVAGYELRQVVLHLDEGRALAGRTAEMVTELRNAGGYRGVPVPLLALERRNTVASGGPDPHDLRGGAVLAEPGHPARLPRNRREPAAIPMGPPAGARACASPQQVEGLTCRQP